MKNKKMTIVIPQWQGGGQDTRTRTGAFALMDNYLKTPPDAVIPSGTEPISPVREEILGYDDILKCVKSVNAALTDAAPEKIFTIGGGCDADVPCMAYLNKLYDGDLAVVYIDAHADLNTPETSESKLYYGMSLRALAGDCAPEFIKNLASSVHPGQLIMCANRVLDPEETRYKAARGISDLTVDELEADPSAAAAELHRKGYANAYIHIDFDALDPEEFSKTPVPEPNGLKHGTLPAIIRAIRQVSNIVGFALLEYSGTADDKGDPLVAELTDFGETI